MSFSDHLPSIWTGPGSTQTEFGNAGLMLELVKTSFLRQEEEETAHVITGDQDTV